VVVTSFQIDRGLFKYDFTDCHAVLGVPIDASVNDIRKSFLKIARRLHPDVCAVEDKDRAQMFLSKLANPAYAKLSNERERQEYLVLLNMTAKRLQQDHSITLGTDRAKELYKSNNLDKDYAEMLNAVSGQQYDNFDRTLEAIAAASELNLVYLLRKQPDTKAAKTTSKPPKPDNRKPTTSEPKVPTNTYVEQYLRRAQDFLKQNNFSLARKELQDALKLDSQNSTCNALLGMVYLKQHQVKPASVNLTMASKYVTLALKSDAKDPTAIEARKLLNQVKLGNSPAPTTGKPKTGKPKTDKPTSGKKSAKKQEKPGLFGGLFGKKK